MTHSNQATGAMISMHTDHSRQNEPTVSEAVIDAVAEAECISPADVRPLLYEVINPDALDDLFVSTPFTRDRTNGYVVFPYGGYEVTVHGDGRVSIQEPRDE